MRLCNKHKYLRMHFDLSIIQDVQEDIVDQRHKVVLCLSLLVAFEMQKPFVSG